MEHVKHHGSAFGKYGLGPTAATSAELGDPGESSRTLPLSPVHGIPELTRFRTDRDTLPDLFAVLAGAGYPSQADRGGKGNRDETRGNTRKGEGPPSSRRLPGAGTPTRPNSRRAEQRDAVVAKLTRLLDSETTLTSSALKQNNLALLRDKLASHKRDLSRLRTSLSSARDRANLLSNVRSDIDEYRAQNPAAAEAEYMLEERDRIDNSHRMADSVLSQAYAVNENFLVQRETLANINRRITTAAGKVPGLNALIGKISAKKRRDGIIMGVFIAFCFITFWWFL